MRQKIKSTRNYLKFWILIPFCFCLNSYAQPPNLSFFVTSFGENAEQLFQDTLMLEQLGQSGVTLKVALVDFNETQAETILRLNHYQIPVYAWLVTSNQPEYWANMNNVKLFQERYQAFLEWTTEYNLSWTGIGLSMNPSKPQSTTTLLKNIYSNEPLKNAQAEYNNLLRQMVSDGFQIALK